MTYAHIAGVPFEELLTPLILTGGSITIAIRDAFRRHAWRRATKASPR